jgi:hypothetical protein
MPDLRLTLPAALLPTIEAAVVNELARRDARLQDYFKRKGRTKTDPTEDDLKRIAQEIQDLRDSQARLADSRNAQGAAKHPRASLPPGNLRRKSRGRNRIAEHAKGAK